MKKSRPLARNTGVDDSATCVDSFANYLRITSDEFLSRQAAVFGERIGKQIGRNEADVLVVMLFDWETTALDSLTNPPVLFL